MVDIKTLTLEEKVGQMIGLAFYGTEYSEELRMQVEDIKAGLIIYFKDNCDNPKQIFELNKIINSKSKIPPFLALDQEGGMVARVTEGVVQSPGAMAISACQRSEYAYKLAYNMGKDLVKLGFNFNFAPVGDINNNPNNPVINVRSYSDNPDVACEYVRQAVLGYQDAGMMTSIKHFPGHGDTVVDTHLGLAKVDFDSERLYNMELKPFLMAKEENLPGIMAAHVMYTKYDDVFPTTLSKKVITNLLREEIGYDGLVVTDSLTMKAVFDNFSLEEIVYNTMNSGCDILLMCGARNVQMQKEFADIAIRLTKEGKISEQHIDECVTRILKYKEMFNVGKMADSFDDIKDEINNQEAVEFSKKVSEESITELINNNNLYPLNNKEKILVVFPKIKVVTLVEDENKNLMSLFDFMSIPTDRHYISIDPTKEEQLELLSKVDQYDKIVYCSYNACFNPTQAELINSIDQKKLIVCAIRTPYDIRVLPNVQAYICSYEATPLSLASLAKVLTGDILPLGKLPVKLN
ncbi:MAG: hypothetical protein IKC22_02430 [Bacilli bacterium]|nr:hypothetical protein [Bacilli bacterium]